MCLLCFIRADVQQLIKEAMPHEWSPSVEQKVPEHHRIKEEQEKLWDGQEGKAFISVKSEDEEEKPQFLELHQSKTNNNSEAEPPPSSSDKQMKTETDENDCGGPQPAKNPDSDIHSPLTKASESLESEVSTDDDDDD